MPNDQSDDALSGGPVMKKGVVNYGESVRARLLAVAKRENVQLVGFHGVVPHGWFMDGSYTN